MYDKRIIGFGFCDIQNNQGLGEGYQPQPWASVDNPYLDLDRSPSLGACNYPIFLSRRFHRLIYF